MSEYERGRRDEAILWREAIFTGTSADLMAWIKKRWAELEAAPGTPAPQEPSKVFDDSQDTRWETKEQAYIDGYDAGRSDGKEEMRGATQPICTWSAGRENCPVHKPPAPPPADETLPAPRDYLPGKHERGEILSPAASPPADETLPAGAATSEQSAPLLKCCCQPIHANNCPFHDARSSQYRHFFAHEAAQPSGTQGEGLRKALERLRDKWVQNSKGQSDSEYTSGMDYQSGVCADELNAALAAARRGS